MTQTERLITYLRQHPGASSLEITIDLAIVNVTGRVSDARKQPGIDVDCRKRSDGRDGYYLTEGESRPGFAHTTADDSPRQVQRKMAKALGVPMNTMREAWNRTFGTDL